MLDSTANFRVGRGGQCVADYIDNILVEFVEYVKEQHHKINAPKQVKSFKQKLGKLASYGGRAFASIRENGKKR